MENEPSKQAIQAPAARTNTNGAGFDTASRPAHAPEPQSFDSAALPERPPGDSVDPEPAVQAGGDCSAPTDELQALVRQSDWPAVLRTLKISLANGCANHAWNALRPVVGELESYLSQRANSGRSFQSMEEQIRFMREAIDATNREDEVALGRYVLKEKFEAYERGSIDIQFWYVADDLDNRQEILISIPGSDRAAGERFETAVLSGITPPPGSKRQFARVVRDVSRFFPYYMTQVSLETQRQSLMAPRNGEATPQSRPMPMSQPQIQDVGREEMNRAMQEMKANNATALAHLREQYAATLEMLEPQLEKNRRAFSEMERSSQAFEGHLRMDFDAFFSGQPLRQHAEP